MAVTLVLLWLFLYDYADGKELPKEMEQMTPNGRETEDETYIQ